MSIVKAALILAVTAFHLTVVTGRVWANQLVPDAQFRSRSFKERDQLKCEAHFIRESVLERLVLKHIQLVTEHILKYRQHFIAVMEPSSSWNLQKSFKSAASSLNEMSAESPS